MQTIHVRQSRVRSFTVLRVWPSHFLRIEWSRCFLLHVDFLLATRENWIHASEFIVYRSFESQSDVNPFVFLWQWDVDATMIRWFVWSSSSSSWVKLVRLASAIKHNEPRSTTHDYLRKRACKCADVHSRVFRFAHNVTLHAFIAASCVRFVKFREISWNCPKPLWRFSFTPCFHFAFIKLHFRYSSVAASNRLMIVKQLFLNLFKPIITFLSFLCRRKFCQISINAPVGSSHALIFHYLFYATKTNNVKKMMFPICAQIDFRTIQS